MHIHFLHTLVQLHLAFLEHRYNGPTALRIMMNAVGLNMAFG
jgi:hypothetical protein